MNRISFFFARRALRHFGFVASLALAIVNGAAQTKTGVLDPQPQYSPVAPGLDYAHVQITNQPWSIHIARLDRTHRELDIITTLGKGTIQGLSALSAQVVSASRAAGRPLVAVNGDFFAIKPGPYQGDPGGLQIMDGELVSTPAYQCFWAESNGNLHIDIVYSEFHVTWPDGTATPMGLNEPPKPDGTTLFTPAFGASSPSEGFIELILEPLEGKPWLPFRANQTYTTRVREIRQSGNTPLNPGVAVLAVGGKATQSLLSVKPGAALQFSTRMTKDLSKAHTAIGGGPRLLETGKENEWLAPKTANAGPLPRHPRTALGFNERHFFLVCVDGRQKDLSVGMSTLELAAFLKGLGCVEALNLDGGGSTTFWLNGKVVNSPSDKRERLLANALVIVQKTK